MSLIQRRALLLAAGLLPAAALLPAALLPTVALAEDVNDSLDRITKARSSLKTLVAPFTQVRSIGLLASEVTSKGELTMVRPDKLRWEIFPPDASTYWILPEGVYFRSGSSGKALKAPPNAGKFGAVLGDILIVTGGDLRKLTERYDVTVPSRDNGISLVAVPKDPDLKKIVSKISMKTTPDLSSMSNVTIEEASGDTSVIDFGSPTRDSTVDPEKMKPPTS